MKNSSFENQAQKYSPDWLTAKWLDLRAQFENKISQFFEVFGGERFLLLIAAAVCLIVVGLRHVVPDFNWAHASSRYTGLAVIGAVFFLVRFFTLKYSPSAAALLCGWAAIVAFCFLSGPWWEATVGLALLLGSRIVLYLVFRQSKVKGWARVALGVLVCWLLFNVILYFSYGWYELRYLMNTHPNRLLFLICLPLMEPDGFERGESTRLFSLQLWFPAQLFYPLPTRLEYWQPAPEKTKMQVRGLVDIVVATIFLWIFIRMNGVDFSNIAGFKAFLRFGIFSYIETYFLSCGLISFAVGMARVTGFNLPDPFVLPLLAASPFERWRRWNSYLYDFCRWSLFFPIAKALRSPFVAIMAVFFVTSLFHTESLNPFYVLGTPSSYLPSDEAAFFFAHGLAVYISIKIGSVVFQGSRRIGWLGVLVTWMMMIAIHTLNRWQA